MKQTKKNRDFVLKNTRGPVWYGRKPSREELARLTEHWNRFQDNYGLLLPFGE